jgi:thiol-disulfide isomerase/thioredoxin
MTTGRDVSQDWIRSVDYEKFGDEVLQPSQGQPVLVDFWAEWCSPCLVIAPFLERVIAEFAGAVLLLLGLLSVAMPVQSPASTSGAMPSVVVQLASVLRDSPLPMRSDFAWLALTQMAEFYSEEAARARRELQHTSRARDASQWAASVDGYARKMSTLAESITTETPISITLGIDNSVHVYVDGQPVILTGAISGQQSVYEQRVVERFCMLYICEDLLPEMEYSQRETAVALTQTDETRAYWSFSQHAGPVCMTNDGLEFQFQQATDLGEKRGACTRAVAELSELAMAIAREQQQGVRVDWGALKVLAVPADEPQRVILAARAEIHLPLPMLAESPELLKMVQPWLKARVRGEDYSLVVLNAGRLMGLGERPDSRVIKQRYPAFNNVRE